MKLSPGFSAAIMPLTGIAILLCAVGHSSAPAVPDPSSVDTQTFLATPDPKLAALSAVCLKKQYQAYQSKSHTGKSFLRREMADEYNVVASECAPTVFQKTGLPHSLP